MAVLKCDKHNQHFNIDWACLKMHENYSNVVNATRENRMRVIIYAQCCACISRRCMQPQEKIGRGQLLSQLPKFWFGSLHIPSICQSYMVRCIA